MGAEVAELYYGVKLNKTDYDTLQSVLYKKVDGKPYTYTTLDKKGKEVTETKIPKTLVLKNKKSSIQLYHPYETDDYLLFIGFTHHTAFNGTEVLHETFHYDYEVLNDCILPLLEKHNITPLSQPNWMLTGRYD